MESMRNPPHSQSSSSSIMPPSSQSPSLRQEACPSPLHPPSIPSPPSSNLPSKIPFRPRKARKLSSSSSAAACPTKQEAEPHQEHDAAPPHRLPRSVHRLPPRPLSAQGEVAAAVGHLRAADPHLAQIIDAHEPPVFQSLHPPFHSLARSILYQQLAFKAAASIYSRFLALCGGEDGVVPDVVLRLGAHQLRQIGVSARKASYLHDLADKYRKGILCDASIGAMDDRSLFTMLNMVKGIGAWSVHMFMIFSLHRPDVLPVGDVGVRKGVQLLYGLDALPRPSQMEHICEPWRPYRSVGSWYMWRLVEAKGMPAALATASSGSVFAAPFAAMPSPTAITPHLRHPTPPQHSYLLAHQQNLLHQHHQHQHQHQVQQQHQLQQSQLVDAIHSIPNLG